MRRRSLLAMGAAGSAAAVLGTGTSALAAPARTASSLSSHDANIDPTSLRALGHKIGLHIGSAIIPEDINTPTWAAIAASQFNVYTPGNEMKWQVVEPEQGVFDWTGADNLVNFAHTNDARIRGHTLVWHNQLPTWLTTGVGNGSITTSQLWSLLEEHIFTEVGRYKGQIWQWDVCNEFFTDSNPSGLNPNDFWIKALGPTVLPQAFQWAHEADRGAILVYNDYNIAGEDGSNAKSDAVFAWAQQMLDQGVPLMAIGNQGHLDTQFGFSGARFQADLERYVSLGLKVAITEADVRTFVDSPITQNPTTTPGGTTPSGLEQFAQPYEFGQMIKAAIAVPDCLSFTVWGFTDADSWVPGTFTGEGYATIYDVNQNPKLAYFELQQDLMQAAGVQRHIHTKNG